MKKIYLLVIGIVISFASCTQQEDFIQPVETNEPPVVIKDNMLVFANSEAVNKALANQLDLPFSTTFASQKDIFNNLMDAEYEHACKLKDLTDEEYENHQKHSDLYMRLLKSNFIKEEKYVDNSILYDLNILSPGYAKILNEQGFYAIKDTIFQMTPTELRVWENCSTFENTKTANYKIKYSRAPNTKSLFPLHSINQAVAYYNINPTRPNHRVIASFYDNTKLAIPNVARDLYVRVSLQNKVDGRNYVYESAPYELATFFRINVDGEEKWMWLEANGTSGNDWYTPYLEYEFLSGGKVTQTYTNVYYYITEFELRVQYNFGFLPNGAQDRVPLWFKGYRQSPLSGPFYYECTDGSSQRLNSLLPED